MQLGRWIWNWSGTCSKSMWNSNLVYFYRIELLRVIRFSITLHCKGNSLEVLHHLPDCVTVCKSLFKAQDLAHRL